MYIINRRRCRTIGGGQGQVAEIPALWSSGWSGPSFLVSEGEASSILTSRHPRHPLPPSSSTPPSSSNMSSRTEVAAPPPPKWIVELNTPPAPKPKSSSLPDPAGFPSSVAKVIYQPPEHYVDSPSRTDFTNRRTNPPNPPLPPANPPPKPTSTNSS